MLIGRLCSKENIFLVAKEVLTTKLNIPESPLVTGTEMTNQTV